MTRQIAQNPFLDESAPRRPSRFDGMGKASAVWMALAMAGWALLTFTTGATWWLGLVMFQLSGPVSVLLAAAAVIRWRRPGRRWGLAVLVAWILLWAVATTFV